MKLLPPADGPIQATSSIEAVQATSSSEAVSKAFDGEIDIVDLSKPKNIDHL